MNAAVAASGPANDPERIAVNLRSVARQLGGIAASVGRQAAEAVEVARRSAVQSRETAQLAADLVAIAELVDTRAAMQAALLERAEGDIRRSEAATEALAIAAERIGSISTLIGGIAGQSRLLALNARIEAARSGEAGQGFGVVANAMQSLSQQTWDATRDIDERAQTLCADVSSTRSLFDDAIARERDARHIVDEVSDAAGRQARAAASLRELTAAAVSDAAATEQIIGRVASAARALDLLGRQLDRAAEALGGAA